MLYRIETNIVEEEAQLHREIDGELHDMCENFKDKEAQRYQVLQLDEKLESKLLGLADGSISIKTP